jgi:hypothetical protein
MADKSKLLEELNWTTDKISSQVWILNFGSLGTAWTLLIAANSATYRLMAADVRWIFIFCITGLLCEFLQHLSGYVNSRRILSHLELENKVEFQYDRSAFFYRARIGFFYLKILLTFAAAVFLLHTLYFRIYVH